ncbi:hypothetical protein [Streptomyces sp. NPDC091209]|uniref:hypothetical protein n=1 Tax=Streptomyces sp. NPDC091209 TaxID=3365974 RepID=UPI003809258A
MTISWRGVGEEAAPPTGESERPTTEWFGTTFHSTRMQHLDVPQSGNGILITSSLAEIDGVPASWPLRIRNNDSGQGLDAVGAALAAGRGHVFGVTEGPGCRTVLAFMPDQPEEGVGTLARVRTSEGPDGDVVFERSAERPMGLWAEAGENLLPIVPLLGPNALPADELEDCLVVPRLLPARLQELDLAHPDRGRSDAGDRAVPTVRRRHHASLAASDRRPSGPASACRPRDGGRCHGVGGSPCRRTGKAVSVKAGQDARSSTAHT